MILRALYVLAEPSPGQFKAFQWFKMPNFYFTLRFSHLADAFIQTDLQIRKSN